MNFVSQPEIDYMKNQVVCYTAVLEGLSEGCPSHCFVHFFYSVLGKIGVDLFTRGFLYTRIPFEWSEYQGCLLISSCTCLGSGITVSSLPVPGTWLLGKS